MSAQRLFPVILFATLACLAASCGDDKSATPPSCSYSVTATKRLFTADGGSGTANVSTGATCSWTASTDSGWVSFAGSASGTGSGSVQFVVAVNAATVSRKARLTIGGQPLDVDEEGRAPCAYTTTPSSHDFAAIGGQGSVTVAAGDGCEWTANTAAPWVMLTAGSSGRGNGTVTFTVLPNPTVDQRTTTLSVANRTVSVTQSGVAAPPVTCDYSVSPVEVSEHWHDSGFQLSISTSAGCAWTASPSDSWLSLNRASGQGSASIAVSFTQFTDDATRRAAVQVRWSTPTAGQNVWVTQEGCRYGFDAAGASFPVAGGTRTVTVVTQAISPSCSIGCPWTASANVSWIEVTSSMPRAGDDVFSFRVAANPGAARTGTISVAGRPYTVSQAGS